MNTSERVRVTTVVAVDPVTAFSIFTEEIGAWWKPKVKPLFRRNRTGTMKFELGANGRLLEVYSDAPDEPFEVGRVLAWEPGELLAFEWRQADFGPNDVTQVEVRFQAVKNGTRVTLEHQGWETLPPEHPARHGYSGEAFTNMIGLRWGDLLTVFRAHASPASGSRTAGGSVVHAPDSALP
jgi:uncharacterized protein YndB with AHSA1/START domain